MAETSYTYDPAVGDSVPTSQIAAPQSDSNLDVDLSHQERADIHAERARVNTAQHLSDRRQGTAGDVTSMDATLFAKQKELQIARDNADFLAAERLEREVMTLAEKTLQVGHEDLQVDREAPEVLDLADTRAGLRQDAAVDQGLRATQELIDNGVLPAEIQEQIQASLASEDVEELTAAAEAIKAVGAAPELISRVDDVAEMPEISTHEKGQLQELFGEEIASDISALSYGARSGQYSFQELMGIAQHRGLVGPLMKAAQLGIIRIAAF